MIGVADYVAAAVLAVAVAAASYQLSAQLHPVIYQYQAGRLETSDIWFDADIPKMACLMSDRHVAQHHITSEHPLISLLTYGPAEVVRRLSPASPAMVLRTLVAFAAAVWIVTFFVLVRLIGCQRIDAVIFSVLCAVSAAGVFWMAVPEAFLPGSVTLLLPIGLVAAQATRRPFSDTTYTVLSAASLCITVTNWMGGLAASAIERPWRRAVQIAANALVAVSLLWFVQSLWFPEAIYFLGSGRVLELLNNVEGTNPLEVVTVLLSHSIVMPEVAVTSEEIWRGVTVQASLPGSSGTWGVIATILWLTLLAAGVRQLGQASPSRAVRILLGLTVAAQLILHLIIGKETFLYVMHVAPLLVAVAACAALGRQRIAVVSLAAALVVAAGVNNWRQFERATQIVNGIGQEAAASGAVFQVAGLCE